LLAEGSAELIEPADMSARSATNADLGELLREGLRLGRLRILAT